MGRTTARAVSLDRMRLRYSRSEVDGRLARLRDAGVPNELAAPLCELSLRHVNLKLSELRALGMDEGRAAEVIEILRENDLLADVPSARVVADASRGVRLTYRWALTGLSNARRAEAMRFIRSLDPRIWQASSCLLDNPGFWVDYERELRALSRWLLGGPHDDEASQRERAYEIWGDEKMFEQGTRSPGFSELLRRCDFDLELLRCHRAALLFHDFYCADMKRGVVLMSENLDMWDSLRRAMPQGGATMLGVRLVGGILGSGRYALGDDSGRLRIETHLEDRGIDPRRVLYVGDIDATGVAIQQALEDRVGIRPFTEMYRLMCGRHRALAQDASFDRKTLAQGDRYDLERFLTVIGSECAGDVRAVLGSGLRIPQEAVRLHDLLEAIE